MKKLYSVLGTVTVLCFAVTGVLLLFMPDMVPAHYNFAGELDRMGSKYESLIFPVFAALMGVFFFFLAKNAAKKKASGNEKVLLWSGIGMVIFMEGMGAFFQIQAILYDPAMANALSSEGIMKFSTIGIGALLIVLGNIMPKVSRNSAFGLRTTWSMANDQVWQKSQRFGGISAVILGLVTVLLGVFLSGTAGLLVTTILLVAWSGVCVAMSYKYYKAEQ